MTTHLSARLAWHDNGWDGCICKQPHLNASCIVQQNIREGRNDEQERMAAGIKLRDLDGWLPPCSRDTAAYAPVGYNLIHGDPLGRPFLRPITEEIPAYTCLPAPYRWLREENFRDTCEAQGLKIRGPENADKQSGWVYEPDRQRRLLEHFWGKVKDGEGKALIFYYVNHGNPVDENAARLVLGVGRIAKVGPQLFFDGNDPTDPNGFQFPIWTRTVTQNYPAEGFRLPYQEYIAAGHDPRTIACYLPRSAILPFSFIGEHVTDDMAVAILERLVQSMEAVKEEAVVSGPWSHHLNWLNDCLADVWTGRGPFPGVGSVLQYLGCNRGTMFHRIELAGAVRKNEDPWAYVRSILDGSSEPPVGYKDDFQQARLRWRTLGRNPERLELLDTLVRFELTVDQIRRISDRDEREKSGIQASEAQIIANPYILCESDLGTISSDPIDLETVDHGMRPEGDAALFLPAQAIVADDDTRRVRAVAVDVLRSAAEAGDTLLTFHDMVSRIRDRFPDRRACKPDRGVVEAEADFHREYLWLDFDSTPQLVALGYLRQLEQLIASSISRRVQRTNPAPDPPIDWCAALEERFGKPTNDREQAALTEKATALETLFRQRISVLTGSAGTGKTSALKVFLAQLERSEGKKAVYLLAPTGKARVRLSTETKRNAFTIHQFLFKQKWYIPDIYVLKRDGGDKRSAPTVIVDECSMVPTDLLGTLFKAVDLGLVQRLILVGDPNQLPPIGPGRPFVDIVAWLQENHPQCIATLRTTMRTADDADVGAGQSTGLAFADGYRSDTVNPADDEILSLLAQGRSSGDLEIYFWEDIDDLSNLLHGRLRQLLGIGPSGDYQSFSASLGITSDPEKQGQWKEAERWQILSPLRTRPFGTEELNRTIQFAYKGGLIRKAQQRWSRSPRPFGDQLIVWTDKVIQTTNQRRSAWPRSDDALDYVANGEIGIVTRTGKNDRGDFLQVGYSTQAGVTYRYFRGEIDESLELAYALTVHKAQGSDFQTVFLIIPREAQTLSRELIYTGLTRFRKRLVLLVEKDTGTLEELRRPERSDTHLRNTNLFKLSLRPGDEPGVPYPEALIHRTQRGVPVRSKSEVIVADVLDSLDISWEYERRLSHPGNPHDYRLPDFTIGVEGDIYYWEHLGMLDVSAYRDGWARKRRWYEEQLGYRVIGPGGEQDPDPSDLKPPFVITSRDGEDGGIDAGVIRNLARKYILLET